VGLDRSSVLLTTSTLTVIVFLQGNLWSFFRCPDSDGAAWPYLYPGLFEATADSSRLPSYAIWLRSTVSLA